MERWGSGAAGEGDGDGDGRRERRVGDMRVRDYGQPVQSVEVGAAQHGTTIAAEGSEREGGAERGVKGGGNEGEGGGGGYGYGYGYRPGLVIRRKPLGGGGRVVSCDGGKERR